jgi:hypothetical protein
MRQATFFTAEVVMSSDVMRKALSLQKCRASRNGNAIACVTRLEEGFRSEPFFKRRQTDD